MVTRLPRVSIDKDEEVIIACTERRHHPVEYGTHQHLMSILSVSLDFDFKFVCQHFPALEIATKRISVSTYFFGHSAAVAFQQAGRGTDEIGESVELRQPRISFMLALLHDVNYYIKLKAHKPTILNK